jgi:hypothetical protein
MDYLLKEKNNSAGSAIPGLSRVMVYLLKVEAEIILR